MQIFIHSTILFLIHLFIHNNKKLPVLKDIIDMPLIMYGDEESAWTTVHQTKLLAGKTHCGRVYDRHHLSYILSNETVEQTLVAILKYAIVSLGNQQ